MIFIDPHLRRPGQTGCAIEARLLKENKCSTRRRGYLKLSERLSVAERLTPGTTIANDYVAGDCVAELLKFRRYEFV
jgi:hypothetical protein